MVILGIFSTQNIRVVVFLEFAAFIVIILKNRTFKQFSTNNMLNWIKKLSNYEIIAFFIIIYALIFSIIHLFGTFTDCDAIWSWNRWANEWYMGAIPDTRPAGGPYPQLITACTAIIYKISGYPFQFFPYFTLSLFPLFCLLIPFSLAQLDTRNSKSWFISVIGVLLFISLVMREVGQADTPVAFMCFSTFYIIYITGLKQNSSKNNLYKSFIIMGILIGGATLTKQAGWYILSISPILIYFLIFKENKSYNFKKYIKYTAIALAIALIMAGTWYLYIIYLQTYSQNFNYLVHLTDKFGFWHKINRFKYLNAIILLIAIVISWRNKLCRLLSVMIIIPFFVIWYHCFGYDKRNVALLLPFSGCILGFSIQVIVNFINNYPKNKMIDYLTLITDLVCQKIAKELILNTLIHLFNNFLKNKKVTYTCFTIFFLFLIFCPIFSFYNLKAFQTYRTVSTLGGKKPSKIRLKIYNMLKANKLNGKVYTNYQYDKCLPNNFRKNYIFSDNWEDLFPTEESVKNDNIKYLFISWPSNSALEELKRKEKNKEITQIIGSKDFYLYKLCN